MTISCDSGASATGGEAVLDNLIEEIASRLQAGELVDREAILARFPAQADSLRRLLPAMELMAQLGVSGASARGIGAASEIGPLDAGLGILGDFRIIREVGRGGMGVVYEAEQLSLGRRVALKVLPFASALDSQRLERFKNEAQAAAQLHHTNIVPVFWVGCERGAHYYAMQYIDGRTLADVIREQQETEAPLDQPFTGEGGQCTRGSGRPVVMRRDAADYRRVARLGIQAAEALAHAHRLGIVHRDIKPANLLVDAEDNLWVTDFGLARFLNESGLTLTGDLLGTLRYMSPEQATARRVTVDERTDIYSLGATLYELLTLRAAVPGGDRLEVLRRIAQDEPVAPRRIDCSTPRDLETIVLKTLAKEAESRYATAGELAEDLRRFLGHRPIKARRQSVVERTAKWSRRHPTVVVTAVSLLVLAILGLAGSLYAVNRERLRTATKARELEVKSEEVRRLAETREWELYVSRVNEAQGDHDAGNVERAIATLDACPEFYRNWEWRYVERLCHRERYEVPVLAGGQSLYQLPVRFTPDGRSWISAGLSDDLSRRGSLKRWDVATGNCLERLAPEGLPGIHSMAVSADGRFVAVGLEKPFAIQIRELPVGRLIHELPAPENSAASWDLAFSPEGKRLVDGREHGQTVVWDLASQKPLFSVVDDPARLVFAVAFHPRGKLVASGSKDGTIHLRDAATGAIVRTMKGHEKDIFDLAFSPDGRELASGGWDGMMRIWDIDSGTLRLAIPDHSGFIMKVEYLPGGERVIASTGRSISTWDTTTGRQLSRVFERFGAGLDVSRDGTTIVTSANDGTVRLWDVADVIPIVLRMDGWVNCVSFSNDGLMVVAGDAESQIGVWSSARGERLHKLSGHDSPVLATEFSRDGSWIISASWDGSVVLWDTSAGRVLKELVPRTQPPSKRTMSWLKPPRGSAINSTALSPDGSLLLTGSWDGTARLRELPGGAERLRFERHRRIVWAVAYSPDGRMVASVGGDRMIRVWNSETGDEVWTANENVTDNGTIQRRTLAFSHDGRLLAGCVGYETHHPYAVKLWEAATGKEVRKLNNPGSQINGIAFSPDDTRIATAGEDATVKLWDTTTGQNVFVLRGHSASVLCVAFSRDGTKLASGSVDATVRIWDASPETNQRGAATAGTSAAAPGLPPK